MDRVVAYANIVAAAQQSEGHVSLPHELLEALLESPYLFMIHNKVPTVSDMVYREIHLQWKAHGHPLACNNALDGSVHETSQTFIRPLSFGRQKCFRLHRFSLSSERATEVMHVLANQALRKADAAAACKGEDAEFRGSNVGGHQEILENTDPGIPLLREAFRLCVLRAAEMDTSSVLSDEEEFTPPSSPRCEGSAVWSNVSRSGTFNLLHNHGTTAFAAVAYARVPQTMSSSPQASQGELLLRLSRGCGATFMEPDEDLHVPRMWGEGKKATTEQVCAESNDPRMPNSTQSDDPTEVLYLRIQPLQGSILVFPAWLPHAVAPHFHTEARVVFASNWD